MHPDTKDIWKHMQEFSFNLLGRAIYDSTFNEMFKPFAHTLGVVQAAHGAEIFIKSIIAKEHPLLIFDKIPKAANDETHLTIENLVENGITIKYSDLPDKLWAATGYSISPLRRKHYLDFGKLRNKVVHLGAEVGQVDGKDVLKFIFEVVDSMCQEICHDTFVHYASEWDEVVISEGYLLEQLKQNNIELHPDTLQSIMEEMQ